MRALLPSRGRRAFTLVELSLAVGMLLVLMTIAIPIYSTVLADGQDQSALSALKLAQVAERNVAYLANNHNSYPSNLATQIQLPSNLSATTSASTGPRVVSAYVVSTSQLLMSVRSATGKCYVLYDQTTAQPTWAVSSSGTCLASAAASLLSSITGSYDTSTGGSGPSSISLP